MAARCWIRRRVNARRTLKHLLKLNVLRRKRQRKYVFIFIQAVLRRRVAAREELRCKLREVSALAATAGRHRILQQMERKRLAMEQRERCLQEAVESIITEDIFAVSIKDMWGDSVPQSTANQAAVPPSRGSRKSSLGVLLAMLARQCLHEARVDDERRKRIEQELAIVQQQELRLRAGVMSGLSGFAGSGLSAPEQALSAHTNADVDAKTDWDAERRQRRQSIGESTRMLLSRAYGMLNDSEYQRYKKHVFAVQDSVHTMVKSAVMNSTTATLPALPATLPVSLFSEYQEWERDIRAARAKEEQVRLVESAQQGKVLLFNGRVIDTGRFQAPAQAPEMEQDLSDPASDSPPAPAPAPRKRDYNRVEVAEAPMSARKGLKNLFLDSAHPDVSDVGDPRRPPLPMPLPRPRSAAAQRASVQQQQQQHMKRLQRGRDRTESPRSDRLESPQRASERSTSVLGRPPGLTAPVAATATPVATPRHKRPSSASATRGRSHLIVKSVCENAPRVLIDSELRSASTTGQSAPHGGWANWSEDIPDDEDDASLAFAGSGHWEPFGFVGSFGGEFNGVRKPSRGAKVKRPRSASATRDRTKGRTGLPPSVPASRANPSAQNVGRAARSPGIDDDRALTMDRSRMLQSMLQGLGFSER